MELLQEMNYRSIPSIMPATELIAATKKSEEIRTGLAT
jgi:hypothetical protein